MSVSFCDVSVVVPTYNERDNIGRLIDVLRERYKGVRIIVVDDNSPDGTGDVVLQKAGGGDVFLLVRKGVGVVRGLTASVLDGVMRASTDFVVVMDADGQHDIGSVGDIVEVLRGTFEDGGYWGHGIKQFQYGVVGGKRRSTPDSWGWKRVLMSKVAIWLGKFSLFLQGKPLVSDVTSGLFGARTKLFQQVIKGNYRRFELVGYKVYFDLLKCLPIGTKVCEVYYDFHLREAGESKVSKKVILSYLRGLIK